MAKIIVKKHALMYDSRLLYPGLNVYAVKDNYNNYLQSNKDLVEDAIEIIEAFTATNNHSSCVQVFFCFFIKNVFKNDNNGNNGNNNDNNGNNGNNNDNNNDNNGKNGNKKL